jgi:haloalkane dehalogenase
MRKLSLLFISVMLIVMMASATLAQDGACNVELEVMTTPNGVEFVRTPDGCFENLPDWDYEPQYLEIDGLQQAYVDEGSGESGETILLLHGQPAWAYTYRDMIPVLANADHRVIAMDFLGMGRSDKPIDPAYYTYADHVERLETFIQELELDQTNLTIFVQDWGSLIGLQVVGTNPAWFDRVVVGNGSLYDIPANMDLYTLPENPEQTRDMYHMQFSQMPEQQPYLRDENGNLQIPTQRGSAGPQSDEVAIAYAQAQFGIWVDYALNDERFRPSGNMEANTFVDLSDEEEAAYNAPFPSRISMGGVRAFPSLANQMAGVTSLGWEGLATYDNPFLTIWGNNDPDTTGSVEEQQVLINHIPGSAGWDHTRMRDASHYLSDDAGAEIAQRVNEFIAQSNQGISNQQPIPDSEEARRNCELHVIMMEDGQLVFNVWHTAGLNNCPPDAWATIDTDAIREELGAVSVMKDGPRYPLANRASFATLTDEAIIRTFGTLEMQLFARLELNMADMAARGGSADEAQTSYNPSSIQRNTAMTYDAGDTVYVIVDTDGNQYIMISYSQEIDPTLSRDDLLTLDNRLNLPEGWRYEVRTLDSPLNVISDGITTVISDEFANVYQVVNKPIAGTEESNATSIIMTADSEEPSLNFELIEIVSQTELRAWILQDDMTLAEYEALELPQNWVKNQPRESSLDGTEFVRSPDGGFDGDILIEEHFGYTWFHSATVVNPNVTVDDEGLLSGSYVNKYHEVTYNRGTTVHVLLSPEGDAHVRIGRDGGRTTDESPIPDGWQLIEYVTTEELVIELPSPTLVIRTDNQDSFQGPVSELDGLLNNGTEELRVLYGSLLQIVSPNEILTWHNYEMTKEERDALELPAGWMFNQPRQGEADSSTFAQSPNATTVGEFTEEEHFGYTWRHAATVLERDVVLDDAGLLSGQRVAKSHALTFNEGRTIYILVSPQGERYIRVSRDFDRTSETFTLPMGWQLVDAVLPQDVTVQLPPETLVIRTDNGDSFQGPIGLGGNAGQAPPQASNPTPENMVLTDHAIPALQQTQFLRPPADFRGFRFCEVLSTVEDETSVTVSVYNTMGHSDCPLEQWNQLDADAIVEQYGVSSIELYGPRYWLLNSIIEEGAVGGGQVADFGGMELRLSGQLTFDANETEEPTQPYIPNDIRRNTIFVYQAGNTVYELTSPDGTVYRMHETGEAVLDNLQTLVERLDLPEGWTYQPRTLERDEPVVAVDGVAHILQDNLGNVYQQIERVETNAEEQSIGLVDPAIPAVQQTQFLRPPMDLRGFPYCEVLAMVQDEAGVTVTVYNTMGHSDCPAEQWNSLDADAIAEEYDLMRAQLNGPRYWLMNSIRSDGVSSGGQVSVFGGMEMRLSGVLALELSDLMAASTPPYTESQIARDTTYVYRAGNEVYELVSPDGAVYRMQSYLLEGGNVSFDDLNTLGDRLTLPDGWSFQTRVLTEDETVVAVGGMATILRDDLENTYQLLEGVSASAQDSGNTVVGITPITIEVGEFTFNGLTAGPEDGELVLLLHGFPQSSIEWRAQLSALGAVGYRAVAPDQRGYSPDARPTDVEDYAYDLLVGDVLAMADVLGADTFHLVGHDWGGSVAWGVAAAAPDRVITLSVFSVPHPLAFDNQLADMTSCQYAASAYFDFLTSPIAESSILAGDAAILRSFYDGVSADAVDEYVELLASEPALRAAINWYRANLDGRRMVGRADEIVTVPTLYVWSDGDTAICRESAEATADYVTGAYRFEVLEGIGHFIPEEAAEVATELLLDHISQ